ncbi:MAG: ATP-binding protein [Promethearchaeota archaeon]
MYSPFFDRKYELEKGKKLLSNGKFDLIIVYGRRRIGKTRYVKELTKDTKCIYNMGVNSSHNANLKMFQNSCAKTIPSIADLKDDYEILLKALKGSVETIILDEYPYMIKKDDLLSSLLQYFIDHEYKKTKMNIILLGSSISMMKNLIGQPSPLFGRKSATIKLEPMKFWETQYFHPNCSFGELLEIYGIADGIPRYLETIKTPIWDWLESELYYQYLLGDEIYVILNMEFREPAKYFDILDAIAVGKSTYGEIANFIHMKVSDLSGYMRKLLYADLIYQEYPINDIVRSPKTTHRAILKNGHYYLKDNFMIFWFRFIYSHYNEFTNKTLSIELIKLGYNQYLGYVFEKTMRQLMSEMHKTDYIGRWWGKIDGTEREIDILAFNNDNLEAIIGECKWSDKVRPKSIMKSLIEVEPHIRYQKLKINKNYSYVIFAKSFTRKITEFTNLKGEIRKVVCYNMKDLSKIIKDLVEK